MKKPTRNHKERVMPQNLLFDSLLLAVDPNGHIFFLPCFFSAFPTVVSFRLRSAMIDTAIVRFILFDFDIDIFAYALLENY